MQLGGGQKISVHSFQGEVKHSCDCQGGQILSPFAFQICIGPPTVNKKCPISRWRPLLGRIIYFSSQTDMLCMFWEITSSVHQPLNHMVMGWIVVKSWNKLHVQWRYCKMYTPTWMSLRDPIPSHISKTLSLLAQNVHTKLDTATNCSLKILLANLKKAFTSYWFPGQTSWTPRNMRKLILLEYLNCKINKKLIILLHLICMIIFVMKYH